MVYRLVFYSMCHINILLWFEFQEYEMYIRICVMDYYYGGQFQY